jgi:hypothetical protein
MAEYQGKSKLAALVCADFVGCFCVADALVCEIVRSDDANGRSCRLLVGDCCDCGCSCCKGYMAMK